MKIAIGLFDIYIYVGCIGSIAIGGSYSVYIEFIVASIKPTVAIPFDNRAIIAIAIIHYVFTVIKIPMWSYEAHLGCTDPIATGGLCLVTSYDNRIIGSVFWLVVKKS